MARTIDLCDHFGMAESARDVQPRLVPKRPRPSRSQIAFPGEGAYDSAPRPTRGRFVAVSASSSSEPVFPPGDREALRRREPEALDRLFEGYFEPLYRYMARLLADKGASETVATRLFHSIHARLDELDPGQDLRTWLFRLATDEVRQHWRRERHERNGRPEEGSSEPSPDADSEARLRHAIDGLPEIVRSIIVLRHFEGFSFIEIASVVGRNEDIVRKRYSHAFDRLSAELPTTDPES